MKRKIILLFTVLASVAINAQVVLMQESFQDWQVQDTAIAYSMTKKLYDGKTEGIFTSNSLIVAPNQSIGTAGKAEGNANPGKGRIAIKGAKSYIQLPELQSLGILNIKASVGTDLKEFKLQVLKRGSFVDIPGTITACSKTVTKLYTFNLGYSGPTTIRIVPTSGSSVYIWDLQVISYDSATQKK